MRILVAEDDQAVRDFVSRALAYYGHNVTTVADGSAALAAGAAWFRVQVFAVAFPAWLASAALAIVVIFGRSHALALGAHFGALANLVALLVLAFAGAAIYFGALVAGLRLVGVRMNDLGLRRRGRVAA